MGWERDAVSVAVCWGGDMVLLADRVAGVLINTTCGSERSQQAHGVRGPVIMLGLIENSISQNYMSLIYRPRENPI